MLQEFDNLETKEERLISNERMGKINVGRGHLPCYYCSNHPKFAIWRLAETSWTPCTASACQLSMEMELALVLTPKLERWAVKSASRQT